MQLIPDDILAKYEDALKKRAIPVARYADYKKWLRYCLDFRSKYPLPDSKSEQVRSFIGKLQKKNQSPEQQKQAAHALSLFFESQLRKEHVSSSQDEVITPTCSPLSDMQQPQRVSETGTAIQQQTDVSPLVDDARKASALRASSLLSVPHLSAGKRYNEWRCLDKSGSPDWDIMIDNLAAEIKTRHYSRKTLKAYAKWGRKFQGFLLNKRPNPTFAIRGVYEPLSQ